jgi:hypothetical protein
VLGVGSTPGLHPVARLWQGQKPVQTLHILENLFGEWLDKDLHEVPLETWVAQQLRELTPTLVTT